MSTSFTKKILTAYITMADSTFVGTATPDNPSGLNTKIVQGLRMDAEIKKGGKPSKNTLKLKIYGMLQDDMDALTTLAFKPMRVRKNLIKLTAGDGDGSAVAFEGEITSAYASYSSPPNLLFHLEATAGYYPAIATSKAKGLSGSQPVAQMLQQLADEMGYAFENNGVDSVLVNPYLSGTAMQKASMIADAADLEFGVDDGVMFVAPRNKARAGEAPLVSAETGLREYPTFDKNGLKFSCLYNPGLRLGGLCVVKSRVPVANGTWRVHGLEHSLASEDPSGKWFSKVSAVPLGVPPSEEGGAE